jgi:DNA-binding NtrC family response regulator
MANLLIIDDDIDSADALAMIMQFEGHEVRVGYNGAEGMALASEQSPDLVLLDVEMPVMDGPGMALAMLVHDMGMERIPVILLSGVVHLETIAAQVGTPYFLGKPYNLKQIVALVRRALLERIAPRRGGVSSTSG